VPIFEINSGNFKAKINTYGASLISLSNNEFNLIESNTREGLYAGSVFSTLAKPNQRWQILF